VTSPEDVVHRLNVEGADPLALSGVNDANLHELAHQLGVRVSLRGDQLSLAGPLEAVERAAPVVLSGRVAILDATYARASFRHELRDWAAGHALRAFLVESSCPEPIVRARLEARAREGRDPSDAGPELYASSAAGFEPPDEFPEAARALVRTDDPHWRAAVADIAKRFALGEPTPRSSRAADAR